MLLIEKSKSAPSVKYNNETNVLHIEGRSVLKNLNDNLFEVVYNFLDKYKEEGLTGLTLEFYLEYFNTSSHPSLVKLFKLTSAIKDSSIVWLYHQTDLEMMEIGSELSSFSDKPITVKQII